MHVLTQFVDQFKLHLAVEESRIRSLKHLIRNLRADEEADYDDDEQEPVAAAAGDEDDHDPDHSRDEAAAGGDAGPRSATPDANPESVFTRIHRPVTPETSFEFLHGLGRYEEKRRQFQAERRMDYQAHLEQSAGSAHHSHPRPLPAHLTSPKSFASTSQQQKHPLLQDEAGSCGQLRRSLSEKRLQHEKYRQELRKQIEEKKFLTDQERRRLQEEDQRLEVRLQKDRGALRREYQNEMANIRHKSRSQPDLRQVTAEPAGPRKVRSPSYVIVNKRPAARPHAAVPARLRFGDKMPLSASISTQTGDSLLEDLIQTPKPEPHPRVSKLSKTSQMRITHVKQKLKENQEKMLLNLASAKHNRKV